MTQPPQPIPPQQAAQAAPPTDAEQFPTDPLTPPAPDGPSAPQEQDGLQIAYFAFKVGGPEGKAVGLFRIADDEAAQALVLERFTPAGEWEDDASLVDDLHQPGVYAVDEGEAQSIQADVLGAHKPDAAVAPTGARG